MLDSVEAVSDESQHVEILTKWINFTCKSVVTLVREIREDSPLGHRDCLTAFQQQLGLKLEASQGSVEVLVIDRAEKPPKR